MFAPVPIPPRVLVVQADTVMRMSLVDLLTEEGYDAYSAASLPEALALLDEHLFDLILADLYVGRSRHSFTEAHLLRRRAHGTPVALLTAQPLEPEEAAREGFAFLMRAPFDLELLLALVALTIKQTPTPEKLRKEELVRRAHSAIEEGDWNTLRTLCTEDITLYPPAKLSSPALRRVRGFNAVRTYLQEWLGKLPQFTFEEMLITSRPKGLVVRYEASWIPRRARKRRMTGVLLYHFRGHQIAQIGAGWNAQRLHAILESAQDRHTQAGG